MVSPTSYFLSSRKLIRWRIPLSRESYFSRNRICTWRTLEGKSKTISMLVQVGMKSTTALQLCVTHCFHVHLNCPCWSMPHTKRKLLGMWSPPTDLRIGFPIWDAPWSGAPVVYGSGPPLTQRHNKRWGKPVYGNQRSPCPQRPHKP
jgi:hypothetical protein